MQNINHDWRSHFITLIKYIPSLAQPLHHGYLKLSCYCRLVENIWDHIWYSLVKLFFPFYFQGSKLAWKPKRWMDDCKLFHFRCSSRGGRKKNFALCFSYGCLGSKESDVGEVQSDDGFTFGKVVKDLGLSRANITFYMIMIPPWTAFPLTSASLENTFNWFSILLLAWYCMFFLLLGSKFCIYVYIYICANVCKLHY